MKDYEDSKPAHVVWGLIKDSSSLPDEYRWLKRKQFIEGARIETLTTKYERNSAAREECIAHYGYRCKVCHMNFEEVYGEIGKNYIHVHHVVEISRIGEEYVVDPIQDLKPVCPNCHAMLHKRKPAYSIDELRKIAGFSTNK